MFCQKSSVCQINWISGLFFFCFSKSMHKLFQVMWLSTLSAGPDIWAKDTPFRLGLGTPLQAWDPHDMTWSHYGYHSHDHVTGITLILMLSQHELLPKDRGFERAYKWTLQNQPGTCLQTHWPRRKCAVVLWRCAVPGPCQAKRWEN